MSHVLNVFKRGINEDFTGARGAIERVRRMFPLSLRGECTISIKGGVEATRPTSQGGLCCLFALFSYDFKLIIIATNFEL